MTSGSYRDPHPTRSASAPGRSMVLHERQSSPWAAWCPYRCFIGGLRPCEAGGAPLPLQGEERWAECRLRGLRTDQVAEGGPADGERGVRRGPVPARVGQGGERDGGRDVSRRCAAGERFRPRLPGMRQRTVEVATVGRATRGE